MFGTGTDAPFVLIAPRQDPDMDVWCGKQADRDEIRRVTGADIPMPYAANLEVEALPVVQNVVNAVQKVCYRSCAS